MEKECDEYLLNPRKIDLEPGVVYLGADGKAFVLYRPVEAAGQKYDPMELTHFVFRLIGQQMPRDSRILNVLSRQLLYGGSFSFAELEPKLKEKPVMERSRSRCRRRPRDTRKDIRSRRSRMSRRSP